MAESFCVYKAVSLIMTGFSSQKNVVIRANIADIVDSVITRSDFDVKTNVFLSFEKLLSDIRI